MEDSFEIHIQESWCEGVDWIDLAQERRKWTE